jgi:hypothetical protein
VRRARWRDIGTTGGGTEVFVAYLVEEYQGWSRAYEKAAAALSVFYIAEGCCSASNPLAVKKRILVPQDSPQVSIELSIPGCVNSGTRIMGNGTSYSCYGLVILH